MISSAPVYALASLNARSLASDLENIKEFYYLLKSKGTK